MIRITRPDEVPRSLQPQAVEKSLKAIRAIAANGKPTSDQFDRLWGKEDVRRALWAMQHGKCAYCERLRADRIESDIEHFRPKAEVTMAPAHKGYWWLAYRWSNLFFSCKICNQSFKKNWFPVLDETKRVCEEKSDPVEERAELAQENAYLIDPSNEDPEKLLGYRRDGNLPLVRMIAVADDDWDNSRARETIKRLGLNRDELVSGRGKLLDWLNAIVIGMHCAERMMNNQAIDQLADQIRQQTKSDLDFAGFRRDFFKQRDLGRYVSAD